MKRMLLAAGTIVTILAGGLFAPPQSAMAKDIAQGTIVLAQAVPQPVAKPRSGPVTKSAKVTAAAVPAAPGVSDLSLLEKARVSGHVGWMAVDLDTGEVISSHLPDHAFAPASVAKLPTAFFAIDQLGADYRFVTRVAARGAIRDEALEGDLILVGGGDPELDTDALLPLIMQTSEAGFKRVNGKFLIDTRGIETRAAIDPEQPVDAAYNPGLAGLNLNFNRARVKWGKEGIRVSAHAARLDPEVATIHVAKAAEQGAPLFDHHSDGVSESWRMSQVAMKKPGERWLPVKNPAPYCGEVFRGLASTYGISLGAPAPGSGTGAAVIASHSSRPLGEILRSMLKYSTNVTAEAVGLASSNARDIDSSARAMNLWAAKVAGFAEGDPGFKLVNHSGLTTQSRVSPRRMVELLQALAKRPGQTHPRLPGPAAGYLKTHNVATKKDKLDYDHLDVVAKTGTMDYIRGLAGYVATPDGKRLAFAIFSNDLARRDGGVRHVNRGWLGRARGLEGSLIRNWVRTVDSTPRG
ncbi:D-alanyl-D-alanine carboxypeptidase/D-alanyl-D-alanine-endopeptidase [Rhodobacteraceae bacterium NNCM2]|nr:D-alanyl-D-alanine carboxypeptidase/D-alanyl-D-alanine-endopeptidase [Coraliihabitans acroporae]